jgi:electron transfer flavoprotein beta subunit
MSSQPPALHIVLCLKLELDARAGLQPDPDGHGAASLHPQPVYTLDPACRCALELALQLRQTAPQTRLTALTLGPQAAAAVSRYALAAGVDQAIHLLFEPEITTSPWATAELLAGQIQTLGAQMVLCGDGLVGPFLAEYLNLPQVTRVMQIDLPHPPGGLLAQRQMERGGRETVECDLPAVVCVSPNAVEPRYISQHRLENISLQRIRSLVAAPGMDAGPIGSLKEVSLPRARPRKIPAPATALSAAQRISFLMSGGQTKKDSKVFEGPPGEAVERLVKFLKEQGLL